MAILPKNFTVFCRHQTVSPMSKAAATRQAILQKAFELIYIQGYQATSIDDIIATTQVTKGAFFYHFKNKDEMGLAVINEVMMPVMDSGMVQPLASSHDPVKDIYRMIKALLLEVPLLQAKYGCPAGNLTQEMSAVNNEFAKALALLAAQWQRVLEASINNGKKAGTIRTGVNAKQVAYFVMSGYWGIRNFGKLFDSDECYHVYLKELKHYLKSLQ